MKLRFVLRQTLNNLWRERTPVTASVLTIGIALVILISLFEVSISLYRNLNDLKQNMVIEVYLEASRTENDAAGISAQLSDYGTIERIRVISKEAAAEIFEKEFGENIYDILKENPLPVMIEVRLQSEYNHPDYLALFKKQVEALPGVDEVHYRHVLVEKLESLTQAVLISGLAVLIVLVFAMNLLIRNTIKLSVYARRDQIAIMKILGAGNLFIRLPYILEGAFEGLFGGMMAAAGLILAHKFIADSFEAIRFSLSVYKMLWIVTISVGILIGFFVSAAAVGHFVQKIYAKK
ncbi:MAG: ABC transporter permease [bacterium]|jgi:cell division transport system permease protein|nr:ABC transporter permease [bacterium]